MRPEDFDLLLARIRIVLALAALGYGLRRDPSGFVRIVLVRS